MNRSSEEGESYLNELTVEIESEDTGKIGSSCSRKNNTVKAYFKNIK